MYWININSFDHLRGALYESVHFGRAQPVMIRAETIVAVVVTVGQVSNNPHFPPPRAPRSKYSEACGCCTDSHAAAVVGSPTMKS